MVLHAREASVGVLLAFNVPSSGLITHDLAGGADLQVCVHASSLGLGFSP